MRSAAALILALFLAWLASGPMAHDSARLSALALGLALIAAMLSGVLLERLRLPRVTGYLVFGILCGPYAANIITSPMARELQAINGLAVVLIALIAGLEINVRRMWPRLPQVLKLSAVTMLVLYAGIFAATYFAWPWIGIAPELESWQKLAVAALVTTIVASFSPTVTIALITESRAAGPFSELTLAVVILADLVLILAFTLVMQGVRFTFGESHEVGLLAGLTWEIFGSFAFGALAGALFALYLRYVGRELVVVLLGFCALLTAAGHLWHFEPLLAALAAGLVVENIAPPRGDMLKEAVERGALPILVVFFAAAGASLQLDALAEIGLVAAAVSLFRGLLIWLASRAGERYAAVTEPSRGRVWTGLVSQAGVTLGLALLVAAEYPAWGSRLQTLMVSLIAIHQFIGPVLFRAGLAGAGEIGRMDVQREG